MKRVEKGLIGSLLVLAGVLEASLFWRAMGDQAARWRMVMAQGMGFPDPVCTTGYCDYPMFWLAGYFIRHGQAGMLYDHVVYAAAAAKILPYGAWAFFPFVYPPAMFLPALVISAVPLVAGYYGFSVLMLVMCGFVLRRAGLSWWCVGFGLVSPEMMWCIYLGQWGALCGALLLLGCALLDRRPGLAGALLGVLCIKPQYALLVPVVVLARRRWRAVAAGAAVLVVMLGLSYIVAGGAAWAGYLGAGRANARVLLEAPFHLGYQSTGISVFWMARSMGCTVPVAYMAQICVSLTAAILAWGLWRRAVVIDMRLLALTMCLTLLATPYGFYDDMAAYAALLPAFWGPRLAWRNVALSVLWIGPAYVMHVVELTGVLTTPLLISAAALLVWRIPGSPVGHKAISGPKFETLPRLGVARPE